MVSYRHGIQGLFLEMGGQRAVHGARVQVEPVGQAFAHPAAGHDGRTSLDHRREVLHLSTDPGVFVSMFVQGREIAADHQSVLGVEMRLGVADQFAEQVDESLAVGAPQAVNQFDEFGMGLIHRQVSQPVVRVMRFDQAFAHRSGPSMAGFVDAADRLFPAADHAGCQQQVIDIGFDDLDVLARAEAFLLVGRICDQCPASR